MNDAEEHLMTVFSAALERGSAAERQAYLDRACADDPPLRHRVEALLRAHDRAGGFLGRVPDQAETAGAEPSKGTGPTADFAASAVIAGRYKLLERIGEGGMGEVYLAQQTEPIRRLVAVKLVKPGMDSRQVLARFEAERQALAMMDHANIAKVLDAGAAGSGAASLARSRASTRARNSASPPHSRSRKAVRSAGSLRSDAARKRVFARAASTAMGHLRNRFSALDWVHFFSGVGGATFGYFARSPCHFFTSSGWFFAVNNSINRSRALTTRCASRGSSLFSHGFMPS